MKVILTEDLPSVGKLGEVVDVREGYARNYLLPRRLAMPCSLQAEQQIQAKRKRLERLAAKRAEALREVVERLNGVSITISAKADGEKLYGSIGPKEIATALALEHRVELPETAIALESPLKTVGVSDVILRPTPDSSATIKVWIVAESDDESNKATEETASAQEVTENENEN